MIIMKSPKACLQWCRGAYGYDFLCQRPACAGVPVMTVEGQTESALEETDSQLMKTLCYIA